MTVALAGADGPTPAPVTVAAFVRDATPKSSCLMVYAALQVNVAFGARLTLASPQLKAVGLIRLSLIVNWAGPKLPAPPFLMTYVKMICWPTWL